MTVISRRELLQIAAGVAAAGATRAPAQADTHGTAVRPARVELLVAERVPERFASLAFEAQELGVSRHGRQEDCGHGRSSAPVTFAIERRTAYKRRQSATPQ
jgi:hypothetical protein